MIAARSPRLIAGFRYEEIIESIDWNRVLIQAVGHHLKVHPGSMDALCGSCIQSVLLRREEF